MKVLYLCSCLLDEVEVEVPDRTDGEDVVHWVRDVIGGAVGADHSRRSPYCQETKLSYVKIPIPKGTDQLGMPVKQ